MIGNDNDTRLFEAPEPPAPTPTPSPEPAPEPVPEPEATWTGPSQQEWQQTQEYLTQIGPALEQMWSRLPAPPAPAVPEAPVFDPFDPNSVQQFINQSIQTGIQQAMAPFEPVLGVVAQERGQEYAREALESLAPDIGQFDTDAAMLISASLLEDPNIDPMIALRSAAEWARDWEKQVGERAIAAHYEEMQRVKEAPAEQQVGNGPSTVETPQTPSAPGARKYEEVVARFLAEQTPAQPVG